MPLYWLTEFATLSLALPPFLSRPPPTIQLCDLATCHSAPRQKKKEKHVVTPIKLSIAVANKAPKWKLHFMTVYSNQIGRNWLVRQRLLALWISAWVKNVSGSFITLFQVWLKSFMPRTNLSLTSRLVLLCRQIQRFPSLWFNVVYIYKPRHHSFLTQVKHKKYW